MANSTVRGNPYATSAVSSLPGWLQVLVLALLVGLAFQGTRHLWEPDEGRYTDVAQLMLDTGDWLTPRLDEERPHYTKPPLTYWTVAASMALFGSNQWAARLPFALAFAGTALLVFGIARRVAPGMAVFAAAVWSTLAGPVLAANIVTTDTLLTLWQTLAVFGFVASGALDGARPPGRWQVPCMWLGFALAFATKGPPGLLPLLVMIAWLAWNRRWRDALRLFHPLGLVVFIAVGLGWYLAVIARDPGLLDYFVDREVIERVATAEFQRNAGAWGWLEAYGPILLVGLLPWLPVWAVARWRQDAASVVAGVWPPAFSAFLGWWLAVPLLVLSLSQSRMPLYVLPLFVPLALWLAGRIVSAGATWATRPATVLVAALAVVAIKLLATTLHPPSDSHRLAGELRPWLQSGRYAAIGFLDTVPAYGLRHYTGLPVQHIDLPGQAHLRPGYVPPRRLCAGPRAEDEFLYLTLRHNVAGARAEARRCGWAGLRQLGTAGRFVLLERERPVGVAGPLGTTAPTG